MKLNFEYCKGCDAKSKHFVNHFMAFIFHCSKSGYFQLDESVYRFRKFMEYVSIDKISEEEWKEIKQMNIIDYDHEEFNLCPYQLEHMLDEQS